MLNIIQGENLDTLKKLPDGKFHLIYSDPPFNTGKIQSSHKGSYLDKFDDYCVWIEPRIREIHRLLTNNGSFFIHMDYREVHYVKVLIDTIFGRDNFSNELIWSYDFGARSKKKWSSKHDTILWYTKNKNDYTFNYDQVDRVPYKAPNLIRQTSKNAEEKIALGKTITDVWSDNIVHTMSKERTGYPTQKPLKIIERIIKVHTNEGDEVLDCFAGSGTLGEAAIKNNRKATLIDSNPEAVEVMKKRFSKYNFLQM